MRDAALVKNVNPKIVSEMPGHAVIAITSDTYSYVLQTCRTVQQEPWRTRYGSGLQ
jgi:hypothetical protein